MRFDFETDYCVVGAGSAGCVVADRLSEDGQSKVLVVEAGPRDWHPLIHIPAGFIALMSDARFNWLYTMEPEGRTGNRRIALPQGKVLGGTSSINGMLFVRGQPSEYERWRQLGCTGWGFDDVLPFFRKAESYADGDDAYRGKDGPLAVSSPRVVHPLTQAFIEAAQGLGYRFNQDMNAPDREGVALFQQNRRGRFRASAARTYLARALRRDNVRLETNALCRRVIFDGRRAIGIMFSRGERTITVRVRREVVLSSGTIRSPHLLQLSGVGAAAHLQQLGIPVVADLPGVGHNLRDHYAASVAHRTQGITTLNERARGLRLITEVAKYLGGGGLLTLGGSGGALFCKSAPHLEFPDLQLSFMPGSYAQFGSLEKQPGMTIAVWQSHPESTGTVMAKTTRAEDAPVIRPNYLEQQYDQQTVVAGLRIARDLFAHPALARWSVEETKPGRSVSTDAELLTFALQRGATGIHLVGTCKMGIDPQAVVTPELKVRGLEGIRVMDASIMPHAPSGNAHAPTVMIAEKGSHLMLNDRLH